MTYHLGPVDRGPGSQLSRRHDPSFGVVDAFHGIAVASVYTNKHIRECS